MNRKMTQSFKQAGFTLLELLVVITLLAVLATGALVAYEGIGENAQDTAAASALNAMESSLRNFRGVENRYPQQYDLLANVDGATGTSGAMQLLAPQTQAFFGQWAPLRTTANTNTSVWYAVAQAFNNVGIEELQAVQGATTWDAGFVPNLALNESYPLVSAGAPAGSELELWNETLNAISYDEAAITFTTVALSIVPSAYDNAGTGAACTADGASISTSFDNTFNVADENTRLNLINDALDSEECSLVIALGIGKDVPGTTIGSRVGISQVATVGTNNVNPNKHYARAIALFHVATDENADGTIDADEVLAKARLIGVVDPEGRIVDQVIAAANAGN